MNKNEGATTLLTPTLGCPAQSSEGVELDEIIKLLRTGSCQDFLEELLRAAGFEVSIQRIR